VSSWEVEYTDVFERWWDALSDDAQESVAVAVELLEARGPHPPYPHSSDVRMSRHGQMRELRVQHAGRPIRVLYAFDPRRVAVLLLGGDKTGRDRWYETMVPRADALLDEHLNALARDAGHEGKP
jgi:hypothetical protein